jgi:hypothetical protein
MRKSVFYCVSMLVLVALLFSTAPVGQVSAASATITGDITGLPRDFGGVHVWADPIGGGDPYCDTKANWDGDSYPYTITGCDDSRDYKVGVDGNGVTFNTVNVTSFSGGNATAPDITPVTRQITGIVYKPNGDVWPGFNLKYRLNDGSDLAVTTNGTTGVYSIPSVNDATTVEIFPNDSGYDGYWFDPGNQRWNAQLGGDQSQNIRATGNRNTHGNINALSTACKAGVTVTASGTGLATRTNVTDVNGHYDLNNLDPAAGYVITPSKTGCVFNPVSQTIDVSQGDSRQDVNFDVPNLSICGKVKTTLAYDTSLAYYLFASYQVTGGNTYTGGVNWAGQDYCINSIPPNNGGTLSISRVGGAAAFGYSATGASLAIPAMTSNLERNFTLTPSRTISGTLTGQNSVPIAKDSKVDFGYGLMWTQPSTGTAYTLTAQPKLYYLEPKEPGIMSVSPLRFLANLTAAPSVANANFTLNLNTYGLYGCLRTVNNEKPVMAANSMRLKANPGAGTASYSATFYDGTQNCDYNQLYYEIINVPHGVSGNVEADSHLLRNSANVDPITGWLGGWNFDLWGNRAITGKIYVANPDVQRQGDDWHTLNLRDAATNEYIEADRDYQWNSWEFTFPNLERKAYTVTFEKDKIPDGFDVQPIPLSKIVTANLATADYDIPAAVGFVLVHKPIDPASADGGGFFTAGDTFQIINWGKPEENGNDRINGYEVQVLPATTAFTATTPIYQRVFDWYPGFDHENPSIRLEGLTAGVFYHYRVRAVYQRDNGSWMSIAPVPTSPLSTDLLQGAAGNIAFTWTAPSGAPAGARYVVQYSTVSTFASGSILLPATTGLTTSTTTAPAVKTVFYWRVKMQDASSKDISDWSPTQMFYNRFDAPTLGSPSLIEETFQNNNQHTVKFCATDANTALPSSAYYMVEYRPHSGSAWSGTVDDNNTFFFTRTSNCANARRMLLDKMSPSGDYDYRISIVIGNSSSDYVLITNPVVSPDTFTVP